MDLSKLTAEQKKQLLEELAAEENAKKDVRAREIANYNQLKDEAVTKVFGRLQALSTDLEIVKKELLEEFDSLVEIKNELYEVNEKQMSHTWTTQDGKITIITGFNSKDRWDDSVSVGITKVNEWLESKLNDENKDFGAIIRELLKPNSDGVLKANRVLDLQNHADRTGDVQLIEAVKIIRDAYRPDRTTSYIKARYKDQSGESLYVPLSMSQA